MLPDVNVLVAAHHSSHPHHRIAADWLQGTLTSANGQVMRLPMAVISGFLRLVTHPKIFSHPATAAQAVDFIDWLLDDPAVRLLDSTQEWPSLRQLVLDKAMSANQIPDAWLAAMALSLGEPFVTFDRDFRRLLPPSLLVVLRQE
jgi:toxin-antitoxin system PIN domain toxin